MPTFCHIEWEYLEKEKKTPRENSGVNRTIYFRWGQRDNSTAREPIWTWERGWVLSRQKIWWWPWLLWLTVWKLRTRPSLLSWSLVSNLTHSRALRRWPPATIRCTVSTPGLTLTISTITLRTPARILTTDHYLTPTWAIPTTARTYSLTTTTLAARLG